MTKIFVCVLDARACYLFYNIYTYSLAGREREVVFATPEYEIILTPIIAPTSHFDNNNI